jgi:ornithine cyclodeaminase/alanine dehydrogenase-like protein (mu-crystallin family)
MSIRFRLLTEADVKSVLTMDDLIETMGAALKAFSAGQVAQPVRTVIPIHGEHAFFGLMPAFVRPADGANSGAALGAKLVTVFGSNAARGLPSHLASIILLDPETGALQALMDGRYITEARTAAVSAVSSRLLARPTAKSLAIIGSGVQARSHLEALSRVHTLRQVTVWSPIKLHRDQFVEEAKTATASESARRQLGASSEQARSPTITAVDHAGEAVVGADVIVLVTSSPTPVIEDGWVKPGAHVISVGACRPTQREMDPALVARARLFVDSRTAALVESGDVVLGIQEGRFAADHIVAEIGELAAGAIGRRSDTEVTIFKSLGLAVEDVTAAELAYRRAVERGIGQELAC